MEIKNGNKKSEVVTIPKDWNTHDILNNFSLKARIGWQGLTRNEYRDSGDYYLVTGTDFFKGKIKWKTCHFIEKIRYDQDKNIQLQLHDVLVTKDGTIGKVAYVDLLTLPATLNSGVFVIRPKNNNCVPLYMFYILNSKFFSSFLSKLAAGSTISHLYQKDFVSFKFPLPKNIGEQKAIAEVLLNTDNLIQSLENIIAKKQLIKQGAMQKLLTPKGNWHSVLLKDVCTRIGVGLATSVTKYYRKIGVPIIRNLNIKEGFFDGTNMRFLDSNFAKENFSKSAKALDVLTVHTGANIGLTCVLPPQYDGCQTFTTLITTPEKSILNPYFLCFHMNSFFGKKEITRLQVGGGKGNLNTSDLKQYKISIPNIEKQTQIVKTLSNMDREIQTLQKKLNKYKQIKQGLMQELLTGKTRLI